MYSGVINGGSPNKDIWSVLTGVWNHYRTGLDKQWLVVKNPFYIHVEATLDAGEHQLPFSPNSNKALYWTGKDSSGSILIKAGETSFHLDVPAFVELNIYGENTGVV